MKNPGQLADRELEAEVVRLAACERGSTVVLVSHLAELYGRRLHERAGFSSLFVYCVEILRLSEHEAYDRMKAAKVARRYPQVLDGLASGDLNLTTVRLLAPHLTRANHQDLLTAARGKRKRQVQELLAARFPMADVVSRVRKLPSRPEDPPLVEPPPTSIAPPLDPVTAAKSAAEASARAPMPTPPPPLVRPLAPARYQITFTASAETRETLELAQDLLRHAIPTGDPGQIFARALHVLVQDLLKQKFAITDRPGNGRARLNDSRHIPAEVKRAVYLRDRGRCVFVGASGRRCGERAFLEFDHHPVPFAAGGRSTLDNLELRCRAHNQYLADAFFGPSRQDGRGRSGTTAPPILARGEAPPGGHPAAVRPAGASSRVPCAPRTPGVGARPVPPSSP
jgi:hypothetical protein